MTLEEGIVQSRDLQQCGHSWVMTDGSLLRIPVMGEVYGWQNLDDVSMKYENPLLSCDASVQQHD